VDTTTDRTGMLMSILRRPRTVFQGMAVGQDRGVPDRHEKYACNLAAAEWCGHREDLLDWFIARQETKGSDAPSRMFCHLGIRAAA
jgi:hypothetical protein